MIRSPSRPAGSPVRIGLSCLCAVLLIVPGCSRPATAPGPSDRVVRDGLGREVRVPLSPHRIVSLAPSVTDSLLALGAGERLVGVTDFCRLPPGSAPPARVGGMLNPDLETIRGLRPDLLVGTTSGNDPSLGQQTASLGLPLYTMHTPDVESVLRSLTDLADVLGEPERGRGLVSRLRGRLEAVEAAVAGHRAPRVLMIVWGDPLVVPGRPSFLTDVLTRAGGASITADAPAAYPTFEVEAAIGRSPEVILTTRQNAAVLDRLRHDRAWSAVPAVRSGRLAVIPDEVVQPGPDLMAAIEAVAAILHPEVPGLAPPADAEGTSPGARPSPARERR